MRDGAPLALGLAAVLAGAATLRRRGSRSAPVTVVTEQDVAFANRLADLVARWRLSHPGWEWDPEAVNGYIQQRGRVPMLGWGAFRIAYRAPSGRVVKVADPDYASQALGQLRLYEEAAPELRGMLVPTVAVDPQGRWSIMESAVQAQQDDAASLPLAEYERLREAGAAPWVDTAWYNWGWYKGGWRLVDYGD